MVLMDWVALVHSIHESWTRPEYYCPEGWVLARSWPSAGQPAIVVFRCSVVLFVDCCMWWCVWEILRDTNGSVSKLTIFLYCHHLLVCPVWWQPQNKVSAQGEDACLGRRAPSSLYGCWCRHYLVLTFWPRLCHTLSYSCSEAISWLACQQSPR